MDAVIFGNGPMGRAIAAAVEERGGDARTFGRPSGVPRDPGTIPGADVAFDASRGDAVASNVEAALAAGCRRIVIATTAWDADRATVHELLRAAGAAAVAAPNLSIGVALFGRLVDEAIRLYGPIEAFDPYVVEWHRRTKRDRPSGTAQELSRRILAAHGRKHRVADADLSGPPEPDELEVAVIRAGASPGMHLVGFDAPGESVELRITARDRSAYAAGALAAADWLLATRRSPGIHGFDAVVDDLLAIRADAPIAALTA
jgi:4-hydroxy-tetrahydrodipicolinate reductase